MPAMANCLKRIGDQRMPACSAGGRDGNSLLSGSGRASAGAKLRRNVSFKLEFAA